MFRRVLARARGLQSPLLGLVLLLLLVSCPPREKAPHIVLITVDTLRADHVGPGARVETPALTAFAARGVRFTNAYAPFGRTTQSVATFLTGQHPLEHGAVGLGYPLDESVTTLAEHLREQGYRTAAFTANLHLQRTLGFAQGFELYSSPEARWSGNHGPAQTAEALAWLEEARRDDPDAPIFLWVHYLDPHWPYSPPAEDARRLDPTWQGVDDLARRVATNELPHGRMIFFADEELSEREIEHTRRLYGAEVEAMDRSLGALLEGLEDRGLGEESVIAFTSDHGESLGEHRYWFAHGEYVYDGTLRVPLLFRAPGVEPGRVVKTPVALRDVPATLLELAGQPPLPGAEGLSLTPLFAGEGEDLFLRRPLLHVADHVLVREENPRRAVRGLEGRWVALRLGHWKLIRIPQVSGDFEYELYDIEADPNEEVDLAAEREELVQRLADLLATNWARLGGDDAENETELDLENEKILRSLGYL